MFIVIDQFIDEIIKEGSEKECMQFVNRYNRFDGIEHYTVTKKKDYAIA